MYLVLLGVLIFLFIEVVHIFNTNGWGYPNGETPHQEFIRNAQTINEIDSVTAYQNTHFPPFVMPERFKYLEYTDRCPIQHEYDTVTVNVGYSNLTYKVLKRNYAYKKDK